MTTWRGWTKDLNQWGQIVGDKAVSNLSKFNISNFEKKIHDAPRYRWRSEESFLMIINSLAKISRTFRESSKLKSDQNIKDLVTNEES